MLTVDVLGSLSAARDGRPLQLAGSKTRSLLARLAVDAGRVVSTDRLIEDVWGESAPNNELNALQVRISQLRKALGSTELVARAPGYLLDIDPDQVDALRAERLIAQGRRLVTTDEALAHRQLVEALALWTGEPFSGLGDPPFSLVYRSRWDEMRLGALEDRIRLDISRREYGGVIAELDGLAQLHPLREPIHELLMTALSATGRQADALAAYRRVRHSLVDELGLEPAPQLQHLEQLILMQDSSVTSPLVASSARAKIPADSDQERPDQERPGRDRPGREPLRGNLPRPLSSFLHRRADVAALANLLDQHRLVTVTGPGGVGKTRLAIEAARRFPTPVDGTWFVALDSVAEPDQLEQVVIAALASGPQMRTTGLQERLAPGQMLIVLDNCEHLVEHLAALVTDLLAVGPGIRILATSQRSLGLPGEALWPLSPLNRDEAIDLFTARARELRPRLDFDHTALAAVDRLCQEVDDLPLAVELAAARVGVLSVTELADGLEDRMALLADHRRGRIARHRTLASTISWSYDLLFPEGQLTLQALAAFADGAPLSGLTHAATAIGVAPEDVLEHLEQLIDRSLVHIDERASKMGRYRLLESIRRFVRERAAAEGRLVALELAVAGWVASWARSAGAGMHTAEQTTWVPTLQSERANVDQALDVFARHRPIDGLTVTIDLHWGWMIIGDWQAGADRIHRALRAAGETSPEPVRARGLAARAQLLAREGDADTAVTSVDAAVALAPDDTIEGQFVAAIQGRVYIHAGRFDEGMALVTRHREEMVRIGDRAEEAMDLMTLGFGHTLKREIEAGQDRTRESLAILAEHPDVWLTHAAYRQLGVLQTLGGALDDALVSFDQAVIHARRLGFVIDEAQIWSRIAEVHRLRADDAAAAHAFETSATLSHRAADPQSAELARQAS